MVDPCQDELPFAYMIENVDTVPDEVIGDGPGSPEYPDLDFLEPEAMKKPPSPSPSSDGAGDIHEDESRTTFVGCLLIDGSFRHIWSWLCFS